MVRLHRGCKQRCCCVSGEIRGGDQLELIKKLRDGTRRKTTTIGFTANGSLVHSDVLASVTLKQSEVDLQDYG